MNGYYSSHRYLTVATYFSSIRNQIDPELFKNSIYIQAVNRNNLRIGIFYDVLPYVLNHIDLETFALLHTAASLFFMLAGIYALAITLTRSRSTAIVATLLYTTQLNNWTLGSPAPYLNFFHHGLPYTYPLIVWSMLFFFRSRYCIALLLTGLSYNFHPMCTLFLLCAYCLYGLLNLKKFPLTLIMLCLLAFVLPALPGIAKTISHMGSGGQGELWLEGVRWVAGYTCNPSTWTRWQLLHAGLFLILACASLFAFPKNTVRRTVMIFWSAVALMCLTGTIFADVHSNTLYHQTEPVAQHGHLSLSCHHLHCLGLPSHCPLFPHARSSGRHDDTAAHRISTETTAILLCTTSSRRYLLSICGANRHRLQTRCNPGRN